ncbi:unnamed protein product, partial [Prorocentrum cordatum]
MSLLSELVEATVSPNVISYNAGIIACKRLRQWQGALSLLSEMREVKTEPNVISNTLQGHARARRRCSAGVPVRVRAASAGSRASLGGCAGPRDAPPVRRSVDPNHRPGAGGALRATVTVVVAATPNVQNGALLENGLTPSDTVDGLAHRISGRRRRRPPLRQANTTPLILIALRQHPFTPQVDVVHGSALVIYTIWP